MKHFEISRRKFIQNASLLTGIVCVPAAFSQEEGSDRSYADVLKRAIDEGQLAGASVCILRNRRIESLEAYGWADVGEARAMTPDTIQNIASVSKTVTAAAVMQLVERGEADLDRDINDYLPFPVRNPHCPGLPITLRHLLTHTSSILDSSTYSESYACGDPTVTLEDWIRGYCTEGGAYYRTFNFDRRGEPGARHRYSNVGFGVLGLIAESVSGKPFYSICEQSIFNPLGMDDTGWRIEDIDESKHATPYAFDPEKKLESDGLLMIDKRAGNLVPHCQYSFPNYADGLVRTSVESFGRFLEMMLNGGSANGSTILKPGTVEAMLTPQLEKPIQGLAWAGRRRNDEETTVWLHTGGDPGVATLAIFEPKDGWGAVVFANTPFDGLNGVFSGVINAARAA